MSEHLLLLAPVPENNKKCQFSKVHYQGACIEAFRIAFLYAPCVFSVTDIKLLMYLPHIGDFSSTFEISTFGIRTCKGFNLNLYLFFCCGMILNYTLSY